MGKKIIHLTSKELRKTNVNDYKSGDIIIVEKRYIIHLKKVKYNTFSLESSVEDYWIFLKFIDPVFWPVYINNFLYGEYK